MWQSADRTMSQLHLLRFRRYREEKSAETLREEWSFLAPQDTIQDAETDSSVYIYIQLSVCMGEWCCREVRSPTCSLRSVSQEETEECSFSALLPAGFLMNGRRYRDGTKYNLSWSHEENRESCLYFETLYKMPKTPWALWFNPPDNSCGKSGCSSVPI